MSHQNPKRNPQKVSIGGEEGGGGRRKEEHAHQRKKKIDCDEATFISGVIINQTQFITCSWYVL